MKGKTCWESKPYRPANMLDQLQNPMIVRLAPWQNGVELEWIDPAGKGGEFEGYLRLMDSGEAFRPILVEGNVVRVEGLEPFRDYEVCIVRKGEGPVRKRMRLFRTVDVPGTVVNHLHPKDTFYAISGHSLGSPSLVKLPSGDLLVGMDVFAGGGPQNLTMLYKSKDRGRTWRYVTDLHPSFWTNLFMHNGRLYAMSCSTEYGNLQIGASDDEGETWTAPVTLFYGGGNNGAGWQQAVMPILRANGRIYNSVEFARHANCGISVVSAPEDADLMNPASWSATPPVYTDPEWPGKPVGDSPFIVEGNVLVNREGELIDMLRIDLGACKPSHGISLVLNVDKNDPEAKLTFREFVKMPSGSNSKSFIRFDEKSDTYYAMGNVCVNPETPRQRNVLALMVSKDLKEWKIAEYVIDYRAERWEEVGFQYPYFIFDGDDILFECRVAFGGARNFHDANFATFHVIENFRRYAIKA